MSIKNTLYYKKYEYKTILKEILKFDYQALKWPLSLVLILKYYFQKKKGDTPGSINTLSTLFRTGWSGSKNFPISQIKNNFISKDKSAVKAFVNNLVTSIEQKENTKKFFSNPELLFDGVIIVLRQNTNVKKGVILIKYSYYFSLFFKLFDVDTISEKYHIVLEPSWAGLCEPGILAYTSLSASVFVMTYEERDRHFIDRIGSNLVSVNVGPNWWVDYRKFDMTPQKKRNVDIVIVAGWAEFKRHYFIFKAIKALKKRGYIYTIALAGYPGDLALEDIKKMTKYMGIFDQVSFHEWISPDEVSELLQSAKVNILWSRFEGNNRAIIEGMFCDTPCIIREGHNYGDQYDYINCKTASIANESNLAETIKHVIDNQSSYSPREYVFKEHNCIKATEILEQKISFFEGCKLQKEKNSLAVKVNELHGMKYFNIGVKKRFENDYTFLQGKITCKKV